MNNLEKPLAPKSTIEKKKRPRVVLEGLEKKRRVSKRTEMNREEYHAENKSSIFTGPENLPFETEDHQPSIDDLSFEHIIHKEEVLPTPEDEQEEFLLSEFKTLDPDIIQEKIRERVESGEYTESPVEDTRFSTGPTRTYIESGYGRYRSLRGVTQEEIDQEHKSNHEMFNVSKEPLTHYEDVRERAESPKTPKAAQNIWKNLKKWISGKQESLPDSHYAKPGRKTGSWFNEFLAETKQNNTDPKAVSAFIEKQHKLASLEDDFYSEQEHPFEEKFEKEIAEEKVVAQAAEEQKENLRKEQEAYDAKIAAEWAPYIKEKAIIAAKEQREDAENAQQQIDELTRKVLSGEEHEDSVNPHEPDEFDAHEKKLQETDDARDSIQIQLDNNLKKAVRKTGRAPRGAIKNVHIPLEE